MAAYSSALTVLSTVVFVWLAATLVIIRKNLTVITDDDSWSPARQVEDKPRSSFATEDVDGLRDRSSWVTSNASSHDDSVSEFSFSTRANHSVKQSNGSLRGLHLGLGWVPPKLSYWFSRSTSLSGNGSPVPPVPPLPLPYRPSSPTSARVFNDPDPFRCTIGDDSRVRKGSQSSWLTEPSMATTTLTARSFPQSYPGTPAIRPPSTVDLNRLIHSPGPSRPVTPTTISINTHVLGGYGYSAESTLVEKGLAGLASVPEGDLDISIRRVAVWLIYLFVPLVSYLDVLYFPRLTLLNRDSHFLTFWIMAY